MTRKLRLGVLASGGGTNLQAIIDRCRDRPYPAEIALVVGNNPQAGALERAGRRGCRRESSIIATFPDRDSFDAAVVDALRSAGVELVVPGRLHAPDFIDLPRRLSRPR